jgi:ABC-type spermidine/putrescine transport system permease subunit I
MEFLARVAAWLLILRIAGVVLSVLAGVVLGLTGGAYHR